MWSGTASLPMSWSSAPRAKLRSRAGEAEFGGDGGAPGEDAFGVTVGVRVLGFDGGGEGAEGAVVGAFEFHAVELAGEADGGGFGGELDVGEVLVGEGVAGVVGHVDDADGVGLGLHARGDDRVGSGPARGESEGVGGEFGGDVLRDDGSSLGEDASADAGADGDGDAGGDVGGNALGGGDVEGAVFDEHEADASGPDRVRDEIDGGLSGVLDGIGECEALEEVAASCVLALGLGDGVEAGHEVFGLAVDGQGEGDDAEDAHGDEDLGDPGVEHGVEEEGDDEQEDEEHGGLKAAAPADAGQIAPMAPMVGGDGEGAADEALGIAEGPGGGGVGQGSGPGEAQGHFPEDRVDEHREGEAGGAGHDGDAGGGEQGEPAEGSPGGEQPDAAGQEQEVHAFSEMVEPPGGVVKDILGGRPDSLVEGGENQEVRRNDGEQAQGQSGPGGGRPVGEVGDDGQSAEDELVEADARFREARSGHYRFSCVRVVSSPPTARLRNLLPVLLIGSCGLSG